MAGKTKKKKKAGTVKAKARKPATAANRGGKPEKKEGKLTPGRTRALMLAFFLAMAIFTGLCVFAPSSAGIVGRVVQTGLEWIAGLGRYALPFGFLAASVLIFTRPEVKWGFVITGATVLSVSILALLHIHIPTGEMFSASELAGGGGLVGAVLAWPMVNLVGTAASYAFALAAIFAGAFLAFEEQIAAAWKRLSGKKEWKQAPSEKPDAGRKPEKDVKVKKAPVVPQKPKVYPAAPSKPVSITEESGGQPAVKMNQSGKGKYRLPPGAVLDKGEQVAFSKKSNEERKEAIENTLRSMDVDARVVKVSKGPTVSLFEVEVGTGEKVKRVMELEQDIAYALGSPDIRIYSPIPGKKAIGIEVPNNMRDTVLLGDFVSALEKPEAHNLLTMAIGKDMSGKPVILDLAQLPHLLIAGSTGAGKSCCINCLVSCLLLRCRPDQVKFIMIDPKFVEFTWYDGLPHLLSRVINEPDHASKALLWAVDEMNNRYQRLQKQRVVHIDEYNAIACKDDELESMPKIVIVIDELADLMSVARAEVETSISRLTAKARAVGIHLIIATQRPSVDVITGVIKNNITARIAFQVASNADSRTILGTKGAEKLLGKGDMLLDPGNIPQAERVQGALIPQKNIEFLTGFIKEQKFEADQKIDFKDVAMSVDEGFSEKDPLVMKAAEFVVFAEEASASMLQTHLRVGYARARRILMELAEMGIVGPHEGSKARKVLLDPDEFNKWAECQKTANS
ncbi:MAG: DUF87 domain-containing protein [Actinobacteria bacterium]|nr:DUF87 domain-containing protein [Actinomycetota bacterium]